MQNSSLRIKWAKSALPSSLNRSICSCEWWQIKHSLHSQCIQNRSHLTAALVSFSHIAMILKTLLTDKVWHHNISSQFDLYFATQLLSDWAIKQLSHQVVTCAEKKKKKRKINKRLLREMQSDKRSASEIQADSLNSKLFWKSCKEQVVECYVADSFRMKTFCTFKSAEITTGCLHTATSDIVAEL